MPRSAAPASPLTSSWVRRPGCDCGRMPAWSRPVACRKRPGVEGETLACGTGTVAAALALAAHCGVALPLEFRSWGGQLLTVRAVLQDDTATEVWLGGQGRLVFRGVWEG
jgi:hypothetical protein